MKRTLRGRKPSFAEPHPKCPLLYGLMEEGLRLSETEGWRKCLKRMASRIIKPEGGKREKRALIYHIIMNDPEAIRYWIESGGYMGWAFVPELRLKIKNLKWLREMVRGWSIPTTIRHELFRGVEDGEELRAIDRIGIKVGRILRKQGYITKEQIIKICVDIGISERNAKKNYSLYRNRLIKENYIVRGQVVEPKANKRKRETFLKELEGLKKDGMRSITMTELKILMAKAGYSEETIRARKEKFLEEANEILSN